MKVRFYLWAVKSKLLGSSGLMLAVKLLGAASAYALAWLVGRGEGPEAYGQFELGLTVLTMAAMFSRLGLDAVMVKWLAATQVDGHMGVQRTLARRASMWVLGASLVLAGWVWWSKAWLQQGLGGDEALWTAVAWGVPAMALWGLASEMLRGLGPHGGLRVRPARRADGAGRGVDAGVGPGGGSRLWVRVVGCGCGWPWAKSWGLCPQGPRPSTCLRLQGERDVVHRVAHVAWVGHVFGHELDGHSAVGSFHGRGRGRGVPGGVPLGGRDHPGAGRREQLRGAVVCGAPRRGGRRKGCARRWPKPQASTWPSASRPLWPWPWRLRGGWGGLDLPSREGRLACCVWRWANLSTPCAVR